ncbi:MAG: signal peptidase I [Micrococcales bacterium]
MTETELPQQDSEETRFRRLKAQRKARKAKRHPLVTFLLDIVGVVGFALVLSLLIKAFVIRSFYIPSESMQTTLMVNDRIVVSEFYPNLLPIEHGDIVVFKDPGGWLSAINDEQVPWYTATWDWILGAFGITAPDSDNHLVKRVIGLPGDHVVCCDAQKHLVINGKSISEPYVIDGANPSDSTFDVTVPADSYWVMGDNRANSADSRFHTQLPSKGFVGKEFIVGKAFVLSWPFDRFNWLSNYPDVFKDVPKS